jgi:formylglycine-generating enzyme required for sulfatase activity
MRATAACVVAVLLAAGASVFAGCGRTPGTLNNNNNQNNGSDRCPSGYVLVPGGTFTYGVDEEEIAHLDISWGPSMGPAHLVTLSSDFCMSQTEISVASYRACRNGGGCTGDGPWPMEQDPDCNYSDSDHTRDDHPVNCLTWRQARDYCQAQGGDLPSDAQWTRAAQGDDRRYYPLG